MEIQAPTSIGKYPILGTLGRGGMGVVYRAQDPQMGRQVAIKTVTEGLASDAGMLARFYREAQKMGMLEHPNIVTVYELGEQAGLPYIVMEFVEGDALDKVIKASQPVSMIQKLKIIEQVCSALGYAHHNDVVHRDVKPANVIVRPDGVAKLLDFGIARQETNAVDINFTIAGGVIGTVPYMAPERLRDAPLDGRSDIFATGVMLFQLLTGRLPFMGEEMVLINQLLHEKHPPLRQFLDDFPEALEPILEHSLAKDPSARYQTAEEMAMDLYAIIEILKKGESEQQIARAETLLRDADFLGAREMLVQLIRSDNQNTKARRLLVEVNQHLSARALAEQAQRKQLQAQEAMRERKHEEAIGLLEEAASLAPDDASIAEQLGAARSAKQLNDQVMLYMRQADAARRGGDYAAAKEMVERAIGLDTNNSRLRAAYQALVKQSEEAAQQAKVKSLIEASSAALRDRNFLGALELVRQADLLDPSNLELQAISSAAEKGIYQEQRRKLLEEIEVEVSSASSEEDVRRTAVTIREALDKSPSDATLLRYRAQVDRRLQGYETARSVEALIKACRSEMETAPARALESARKGIAEFPGEERLLALEAFIQERVARQTVEERRNSIVLGAREALSQLDFAQAITMLEVCPTALKTPETEELLNFAREEHRRDLQQKLKGRAYVEARALLEQQEYPRVVDLLVPILKETEDAQLRSFLSDAEAALARQQAEIETASGVAKRLLESGAYEQVVVFVAGLPPFIADLSEVREMLVSAKRLWKEQTTQYYRIGQAYAALDSNATGLFELSHSAASGEFYRRLEERRAETIKSVGDLANSQSN